MSDWRARLAWTIAVVSGLAYLGSIPLILLAPGAPTYAAWSELGQVGQYARLVPNVALLAFPAVGALIAARRPGNGIGWSFLGLSVYSGLYQLDRSYAVYELYGPAPDARAAVWAAWLQQSASAPLLLFVGLILLLFPTGRAPSPRWSRWMTLLAIASCVAMTVGGALRPGALAGFPGVVSPIGIDAAWPGQLQTAGTLLSIAFVVMAAASVVVRFTGSVGVERQQMKLFVYAAVLTLSFVAPVSLVWGSGGANAYLQLLGIFSIVGMPAATAIAILRHRLFDIDLLINRTLVYGSLSAMLAATYVVMAIVLETLLRPLTGQSELAVAGSTLATLALVQPLRARIQRAVDRRFYRARYDAARTLDAFAERLSNEVDLDTVRADLLDAVTSTVQPLGASLWLREPEA